MVVHGQQAEQVIVVLGDGLARPVFVDRADLEFLVVPTEPHAAPPHPSTLPRDLARPPKPIAVPAHPLTLPHDLARPPKPTAVPAHSASNQATLHQDRTMHSVPGRRRVTPAGVSDRTRQLHEREHRRVRAALGPWSTLGDWCPPLVGNLTARR